ncbi:MAG: hypothetical protein IPN46_18775 [Saprospiraceae bacterium]|nr:hypothetical protein [Saprospiraceae bacterium]
MLTKMSFINITATNSSIYPISTTLNGLSEPIEKRVDITMNRILLVNTLASQYANLDTSEIQYQNNAYPRRRILFRSSQRTSCRVGGPAFHSAKYFPTINLANQRSAASQLPFVPVFINGVEGRELR